MIFINKKYINKIGSFSRGSLLLELLIVISLIAVILSFSSNAMFLSMKGNKIIGDKDTASALASEALESVRSVTEEDYYKIYNTTKASQHYYLSSTITPGKWVLTSGDESVPMNGVSYIRYIIIDNVSRDSVTRNIQPVYSLNDDDPSTQKVTVFVTWPNGGIYSTSDYFFRWKNKVCDQPGWTSINPDNTLVNCGDTTFYSKDDVIDVTGGTIKLQQ